MVVREYEWCDPGHKGEMINIVFPNISTFAEYLPKELKGKPMPGHTLFVMNNGQVLLCKADIKQVKQIISTMRNS